MVRSLDHEGPEPDADSDASPPLPPNPVCPKTTEYQVDPQRLKELLDEYPEVFPDSIPGLPPDRKSRDLHSFTGRHTTLKQTNVSI